MELLNKLKRSNTEINTNKNEDNIKLLERRTLINKIGVNKITLFCDRYCLKYEDLSIDFLRKLISSEELLNYLNSAFLTINDIKKMNDGTFSLNDVEGQYDILEFPILFSGFEREKVLLLNKDISVLPGNYISVQMDNLDLNNLSPGENYDIIIPSYFGDVNIKKQTKKILPVELNDMYSISKINILYPCDNIFYCVDRFSYCITEKINLDSNTIIIISLDKFKELTKLQVENLNGCMILLAEDIVKNDILYNSFANKSVDNNFPTLNSDSFDDEIVKINHLLFIVDNSVLEDNRKKYFKYWIKKYSRNNQLPHHIYEIIDKLTKEIGINKIKMLSNKFDDLEYNDKIKDFEFENYDISTFLGEFKNIDTAYLSFLINAIAKLNTEERKVVLNDPEIKNRLGNKILSECGNNIYGYFGKIKLKLSVTEILSLFDVEMIRNNFTGDRKSLEYRVFASLCESDDEVIEVIKYLLNNNEMFIEFFNQCDNFCSSFDCLSGDMLKKVLYRLKENKMTSDCYDFVFGLSLETQKYLIDEKLDDDIIAIIVPRFKTQAITYFFESDSRSNYLFKKMCIASLIGSDVIFNNDVLRSKDFFDMLKNKSFVDFRTNINNVEVNNLPEFIEKHLKEYYEELFNNYDEESKMFKEYTEIINNSEAYINYSKFNNYILDDEAFQILNSLENTNKSVRIEKLKNLTNKKISEITVDALFADNIYNVWINIKEMIRFNGKLPENKKILDNDKIKVYEMILNIDNVSCTDKIKLYHSLKEKNISTMFYEDVRRLKDASYNLIKSKMFTLKGNFCDSELSNEYGMPIYDMRDKSFFMLVRSESKHKDKDMWRRNCYSIISNDNTSVYSHGTITIYGYNSFENDRVLHMFEGDAYSEDESKYFGNREKINRIMTPEELVNSSRWYSEVQLVNLKDECANKLYIAKKPDFIVVYDAPDKESIEESMKRNIPIVIIKRQVLEKNNKINIGNSDYFLDGDEDIYINSSYDEKDISKKIR